MQTESKVQQRDADVTAHISAYPAHTQIIRNVQRMMVLKLDEIQVFSLTSKCQPVRTSVSVHSSSLPFSLEEGRVVGLQPSHQRVQPNPLGSFTKSGNFSKFKNFSGFSIEGNKMVPGRLKRGQC